MAAPSYNLINDYFGLPQDVDATPYADQLTLNPYWVLAVFPFQEEVTFQRSGGKSYDQDPSVAVRTGRPLIITSDCVSLQVHTSKDTPVGNMQAVLNLGEVNYLSSIFPGDWCAAWILQSEDDAQDLIKRLSSITYTHPCNRPQDGLKFIGRVMSMGKNLVQSPGGPRNVTYNLQASSFMEMESAVFFDPALTDKTNRNAGNFLAKLSQKIQDFISKDSVVRTQKAVPFLMNLLLGAGLPPVLLQPDPNTPGIPPLAVGSSGQDRGVTNEDAPYAYLIPADVGAIVGKTNVNHVGQTLSGFDFTEAIIGVQNYSQKPAATIGPMFAPDGLTVGNDQGDNYSFTPTDMLGAFTPNFPEFTGQPTVWTLIGKYVNEAINERYATLRVNKNGLVVPSVIIRQIPFTTNVFADSLGAAPGSSTAPGAVINNSYLSKAYATGGLTLNVTRFLELPRWVVHPLMVSSSRLLRTDALRCNFVHIYGQPVHTLRDNTAQAQIVKNPPIQDLADMKRSGLRVHIAQVSCAPSDITRDNSGYGPSLWMALVSDWRMGMHLDLTGTINMTGVTAPICIGDNVEFDDGIVGHIEAVLHSAQIDADGQRSFVTTVNFSHGIRSDNDLLAADISAHPDVGIYAGVGASDQTKYDPGLTHDGNNSVNYSSDANDTGSSTSEANDFAPASGDNNNTGVA